MILAVLSAAQLAAGAPTEVPAKIDGVWALEGVVLYRGPLEQARVQQAIRLLEGRNLLVIDSVGGDEFASLDLAEAILKADVRVHASGLCLSGCANLVLAAGSSRSSAPGTIIGYHGSAVASLDRYRRIRRQPPPRMEEVVQRYEALYAQRGIDIDLLRCAADKIGMTTRLRIDPATKAEGWYTKESFWFVSTSDLLRYGMKVKGGPLSTTTEGRQEMRRLARVRPEARIVWSTDGARCR